MGVLYYLGQLRKALSQTGGSRRCSPPLHRRETHEQRTDASEHRSHGHRYQRLEGPDRGSRPRRRQRADPRQVHPQRRRRHGGRERDLALTARGASNEEQITAVRRPAPSQKLGAKILYRF